MEKLVQPVILPFMATLVKQWITFMTSNALQAQSLTVELAQAKMRLNKTTGSENRELCLLESQKKRVHWECTRKEVPLSHMQKNSVLTVQI